MATWYVDLLRCSNRTLYTGITNDLTKRLKAHQAGKGAKYTRSRLPVELVYQERRRTKGRALQREAEIKKWSKDRKETLAGNKTPP